MQARHMLHAIAIGAAVLTASCGSLVDDGYQGEGWLRDKHPFQHPPDPDASTDEFRFVAPYWQGELPADHAIAMVWDLHAADAARFGELLDSTTDLTSGIYIQLPAAPAEDVLIAMADGNALAVARFELVNRDHFNPVPGGGWSGSGVDDEHVLIYVKQDVAADSATARFLGSAPSAGYHIFDLILRDRVPCQRSTIWDERGFPRFSGTCPEDFFQPAVAGLDTALKFVLPDSEIYYPNPEVAQ